MTKLMNILALLLITISASAQLNIKVGFDYNRSLENKVLETISSLYNADRPFLEVPLEPIKSRSGLALGVRYKVYNIGIELSASRGSGSTEALGTDDNVAFSNKMTSSTLYYGAGIISQFGTIGIGASIGYQKFTYKTKITGSSKSTEFYNEKQLASRLHLNFEFPSDRISFAIQPYYQFSLEDYDLTSIKDELVPNSNLINEDLMVNPSSWGITIALYNGRH